MLQPLALLRFYMIKKFNQTKNKKKKKKKKKKRRKKRKKEKNTKRKNLLKKSQSDCCCGGAKLLSLFQLFKYCFPILNDFFLGIIMYQIVINNNSKNSIASSSRTLECKGFSKTLHHSPADRHAYSAKFFLQPVRYKIF